MGRRKAVDYERYNSALRVKVTDEFRIDIQRYANDRYNGNLSSACRDLLERALRDSDDVNASGGGDEL